MEFQSRDKALMFSICSQKEEGRIWDPTIFTDHIYRNLQKTCPPPSIYSVFILGLFSSFPGDFSLPSKERALAALSAAGPLQSKICAPPILTYTHVFASQDFACKYCISIKTQCILGSRQMAIARKREAGGGWIQQGFLFLHNFQLVLFF